MQIIWLMVKFLVFSTLQICLKDIISILLQLFVSTFILKLIFAALANQSKWGTRNMLWKVWQQFVTKSLKKTFFHTVKRSLMTKKACFEKQFHHPYIMTHFTTLHSWEKKIELLYQVDRHCLAIACCYRGHVQIISSILHGCSTETVYFWPNVDIDKSKIGQS